MRVLVITDDRLGPTMAGSGLRAWELARALSAADHLVCVVGAAGSRRPSDHGPEVVNAPPWAWAEVVVAPAWSLPPQAFLRRGQFLVVDGATPLLAELAAMPDSENVVRRRRTAAARLPLVAARSDAVLVASRAQARWWVEVLRQRDGVPLLEVPFGIPDEPPPAERDELPGVPRDWAIVLWWGGVWPWLDLETLLQARARLGRVPVSVVVPTAPRPGDAAFRFTAEELWRLAGRHGLEHPQVVALERWIPYHERHRLLHRTTLIAVLHHPGEEAELSFRTRALDGVWAAVPLLLTEGGEVARLARKHRWGAVVPPHDPSAVAASLELMLSEREQLCCRSRLAAAREQWRWSRVVVPLADILPRLPLASRRGLAGASLRAGLALLRHRTPRRLFGARS